LSEEVDIKSNEVYEAELSFYGPKGNTFGQKINLKLKISEAAYQLKLYKTAITLTEAELGTFDECVEALKKCNGDDTAAC
jgi:hypothetical protein